MKAFVSPPPPDRDLPWTETPLDTDPWSNFVYGRRLVHAQLDTNEDILLRVVQFLLGPISQLWNALKSNVLEEQLDSICQFA